MKTSFIKITVLFICFAVLLGSFTSLAALADDTSNTSSKEVNIWDLKRPAYTNTQFTSVRNRLAGDGGYIDPMSLFAVNTGYAFYTDQLTGEVVILKLKDQTLTKAQILESGEIPEYSAFYCTNPYTIGSAKAIGSTNDSAVSEKEKLYAQIFIRYSENDKDKEMNSFVDCAVNNQITFKNIRGGIRVEYTIGREEVVYLVPRMIRVEKLEALRDAISANSLSKRDAKTFMAYYIRKDLNDPTLSEKSKKEMETQYPITKNFAIYICEPVMSAQELLRLERFVRNYTTYDYDQLEADHAETEYTSSDDVPPLFKLALEYRVEGDENGSEIVIRCNAGNIRFDSSTYKLSDVLILPYGGAGDVNNSGYMFSPDGAGSLLDFKDLTESFTNSTNLYGADYAYHSITGANTEIARLPAFGVYQRVEKDSTRQELQPKTDPETGETVLDDDGNIVMETVTVDVALEIAYLAVIEAGDSLAKVNVTYGGALHNFASIYTSFNPRPKDSYVLDGGISAGTDAMWTVESKRKYTGDFKIRLFILDGTEDGDQAAEGGDADKSYSDMAAAYRDYLIRIGELKENPYVSEDIPLYLETLGSIPATRKVLGIPVTKYVPLTTFEDTIGILKELGEKGIDNVNIKLSGWYNKGMIPEVPTKINIEKSIGGEDGFKKLLDYTNQTGATLFPDIELAYAYRDAWFDGFDPDDDASQTIDERNALKREYDPVWQGYLKGSLWVISPNSMMRIYDEGNKDYSKLNVGAISVCSLGDSLSSDFNTDDPLTREDSKELVMQLLNKISQNNKRVLVSGGNNYAIKYVTDIVDMPLEDSRYVYSYASVPFMSMVLHGSKNYAGTPLNLAGDYNAHLLKTVESGAAPYFVIATSNTSDLKEWTYSTISRYYSVRYNIWKNDIIAAYKTLNEALKDVQTAYIRKHEILTKDGNVVRVTYSNGISFVINYNISDYEYTEKNITVPAESFIKFDAKGTEIMKWEGANE